jgi:hypothetical protein
MLTSSLSNKQIGISAKENLSALPTLFEHSTKSTSLNSNDSTIHLITSYTYSAFITILISALLEPCTHIAKSIYSLNKFVTATALCTATKSGRLLFSTHLSNGPMPHLKHVNLGRTCQSSRYQDL